MHCLSELGPPPESIPWLVKAFPLTTNETYVVRHDLLLTLGHAGTNAAQLAMPIALASLSDQEWDVRSVAAQACADWGCPEPAAIPLLLTLLTSTNEYAAMSAAMALGRITNRLGRLAQPLIPVLRKVLNDPKREVRHEAMVALELLEKGKKN